MSESNYPTYEYDGETITYNVSADEWRWSGSNRGFEKLSNAMKSIDRAHGAREDKKPKFEKQSAIWWHYSRGPQQVEVTGIEDHSFWIKDSDGTRHKESASDIYAATEGNALKISQWYKLIHQIEVLKTEAARLKDDTQKFSAWLAEKENANA